MIKNNKEKPNMVKRVAAYLIDIIFVMLLSTAITMVFVDTTKYQERTEKLMELTKKYTDGTINKEEYSKEFDDMNYYLTKEGVGTSIVTCSVGIVYYVILCYFCHGITLGKYLMKLQIVSANGKKLNIGHFLIRALLVNLLLSNLVSIIFVSTMSKDTFVSIYPKVSNAITIFLLATIIFTMYRNDGRGLHDLIANTKIISTKEPKVKEENEEVLEAKVIEEKEEVEKKKTTKKKSTTKKTGGKK